MEFWVETILKTRMMSIWLHIGSKNINIGKEQNEMAIKGLTGTKKKEICDKTESERILKEPIKDDTEKLRSTPLETPQQELDMVDKQINARIVRALMHDEIMSRIDKMKIER